MICMIYLELRRHLQSFLRKGAVRRGSIIERDLTRGAVRKDRAGLPFAQRQSRLPIHRERAGTSFAAAGGKGRRQSGRAGSDAGRFPIHGQRTDGQASGRRANCPREIARGQAQGSDISDRIRPCRGRGFPQKFGRSAAGRFFLPAGGHAAVAV